jgi:hypothetical protein
MALRKIPTRGSTPAFGPPLWLEHLLSGGVRFHAGPNG